MSAATAIRDFIAPLLPGWVIQLGKWNDELGPKVTRFVVIQPAGGIGGDLIRQPQFTLSVIGAANDRSTVVLDASETIIEAMRVSSGSLVFMQAGEPAFTDTTEGRPVSQFAVSTIIE